MPIQTTCPACERGYNLPDTQRGKRVRCKNCSETFVVGGPAAAGVSTATATEDVPVLREVSEEEARQIKAENRIARAAGKLPPLPAPAGRRPTGREGERPRAEAPKKKSSLPLILGGAAVLLFLLCGGGVGVGGLIWYLNSDDDSSQQASNDPAPEVKPPEVKPPVAPVGGNNPVKPAENPFKPPADNPFRPPVVAPPVVPRDDPNAPPTTIDRALTMLRAEQIRTRQVAADWLVNRAVDPRRQKEVSQALEPLLDDSQTREHAARALGRWATRESVPALIKALDYENGNAWAPIIDALARLKDERAAAALVTQLPNFFRREAAARALQNVGPAAEKEVVKLIHHKDFGVRQKATQLLKNYNTKDEVLITQHVTDLAAMEPETRRLAAEDLAKVKADPARQGEVARALDPLLTDTDRRLRDAAVNALANGWAIKDNTAGLLKVLDDGGLHDRALLTLIRTKDDKALPVLAQRLTLPQTSQQRRKISQAMVAIGPPAKVEQVAAPYLGHMDLNVRREAVLILHEVGGPASIKLLQVVGSRDRNLYADCVAAVTAIRARQKGGLK